MTLNESLPLIKQSAASQLTVDDHHPVLPDFTNVDNANQNKNQHMHEIAVKLRVK